jgi:protein phosphatase
MRVLGDVESAPEVDTSILATLPGDRWMLCSDGLSGVVAHATIAAILMSTPDAREAAERLVRESLDGGAPDNVTVVVVDIGEGAPARSGAPALVGSAAGELAFGEESARVRSAWLPTLRLHPVRETHFEPDAQDYLSELIEEDERRARRRKITWLVGVILLAVAILGGAVIGYQWTQTRYYVGVDGSSVAIFKGVQQDLGPFPLSQVHQDTDVNVADLRAYDRQQVENTISASSLEEAHRIVERLNNDAD